MLLDKEQREAIYFSEGNASIRVPYKGSAERGMLLWLDENLVHRWWKHSSAKIEPEPGGMFYIRWLDKENSTDHAVYGIMSDIDTEQNRFSVSKLIYIHGEEKITGMRVTVELKESEKEGESFLHVSLGHQFREMEKRAFENTILQKWPEIVSFFKKYTGG